MNSVVELQTITDSDISSLNNDELLEVYKMIRGYVNELVEKIEKVNEDDK